MKSYGGREAASYGNFYSGPYANRKPSNTSFVEFNSQDGKKRFLDAVGKRSSAQLPSAKVTIDACVPDHFRKRNWCLREAERQIKASPMSSGKNIECLLKERVIKVDGSVVFAQERDELSGRFSVCFSDLTPPVPR